MSYWQNLIYFECAIGAYMFKLLQVVKHAYAYSLIYLFFLTMYNTQTYAYVWKKLPWFYIVLAVKVKQLQHLFYTLIYFDWTYIGYTISRLAIDFHFANVMPGYVKVSGGTTIVLKHNLNSYFSCHINFWTVYVRKNPQSVTQRDLNWSMFTSE